MATITAVATTLRTVTPVARPTVAALLQQTGLASADAVHSAGAAVTA